MFCLNLLYHLWYQLENTYFAKITPPPYEPSIRGYSEVTQDMLNISRKDILSESNV